MQASKGAPDRSGAPFAVIRRPRRSAPRHSEDGVRRISLWTIEKPKRDPSRPRNLIFLCKSAQKATGLYNLQDAKHRNCAYCTKIIFHHVNVTKKIQNISALLRIVKILKQMYNTYNGKYSYPVIIALFLQKKARVDGFARRRNPILRASPEP